MERKKVSASLEGLPVPYGSGAILCETLSYMLEPNIIGSCPEVLVVTPGESQFYLDFARPSHDDKPENLSLLRRRPETLHIFLAVGTSCTSGSMGDHVTNDLRKFYSSHNGNHFVCLHVDILRHIVELKDSSPSVATTSYVQRSLRNLSRNIYDNPNARLTFYQSRCTPQAFSSNDCAIHTWRNIVCALTEYQVVPVFGDVQVQQDDICRDTFRLIFEQFYT